MTSQAACVTDQFVEFAQDLDVVAERA